MNFLKKGKETAPGSLTAIGKAKGKLSEITTAAEIADKESQAKILGLHKKKAALKVEHDDLAGRISSMTGDFKKIFDEIRAAESTVITEQNATKKDLDAGRLSIREFLLVHKKPGEVEKEARAAAGERLSAARDSIRGLRFIQYEIEAKAAGIQEAIAAEFNHVAENFWHLLDGLKRGLEEQGISSSGIIQGHSGKLEADNNLSLTKGAVIFHGKQWTVQNADDIRILILDPIVKIEHAVELEKLADQLEDQAYPLTINYWPSEGQGRNAGFTYFLGPKSYEARR